MNREEIQSLASDVLREWLKEGPDLDFLYDYFDGDVDARTLVAVEDQVKAIIPLLTVPED
ncbi:hypothetical protein [Mycobacteroides chelonae]|uniref:hypothetical protein n=1 Tax=Mycobacteroides chelonae TaxID=1774 RepID=UPI0008A8FB6B|nr:hypothetical protein [Mycobacteroides chelonae]OHT47954.1 hypothetical protein BKG63_24355 [Mycobacteroides chelonae]OHT91095.1 hypothetical protein BKG71_25690 [Mycobacteroides chelonae]OHT99598.1 hypothetical protein BKG72_04025 [Mycobacteroides chelonae]OLT92940.1 hypothetical protein BKG59_05780 [Mycobacteroides chelonae]